VREDVQGVREENLTRRKEEEAHKMREDERRPLAKDDGRRALDTEADNEYEF
jgi:hypothetical protein